MGQTWSKEHRLLGGLWPIPWFFQMQISWSYKLGILQNTNIILPPKMQESLLACSHAWPMHLQISFWVASFQVTMVHCPSYPRFVKHDFSRHVIRHFHFKAFQLSFKAGNVSDTEVSISALENKHQMKTTMKEDYYCLLLQVRNLCLDLTPCHLSSLGAPTISFYNTPKTCLKPILLCFYPILTPLTM